MILQKGFAQHLMPPIHAAVGNVIDDILRQAMQKVTNIVQQRRGDQVLRRALLFRQVSGLQCVLLLGDRLAQISRFALGFKQVNDAIDDGHDCLQS
jgi:hypothetical protein